MPPIGTVNTIVYCHRLFLIFGVWFVEILILLFVGIVLVLIFKSTQSPQTNLVATDPIGGITVPIGGMTAPNHHKPT
jgi:chromate transport protein ChrA